MNSDDERLAWIRVKAMPRMMGSGMVDVTYPSHEAQKDVTWLLAQVDDLRAKLNESERARKEAENWIFSRIGPCLGMSGNYGAQHVEACARETRERAERAEAALKDAEARATEWQRRWDDEATKAIVAETEERAKREAAEATLEYARHHDPAVEELKRAEERAEAAEARVRELEARVEQLERVHEPPPEGFA